MNTNQDFIAAIDEPARLKALLMRRAAGLHEYVRRRIPTTLQSVVVAEDVLQEVWLCAFRTPDSKRPENDAAVDRWLTTITRHQLLNALRNARRLKRGGRKAAHRPAERTSSWLGLFHRVASPARTPSSEQAVVEAAQAIQMAICDLPSAQQRAVSLHYLEGRSHEETAQVLQRTKAAVNSLLFRALQRLRSQLGPMGRYFSDPGSSRNVPLGK